jgi:hypothetical protein
MNINDQMTRQAQEMLDAAKNARIPENVQAFAEESVTKGREMFEKMSAVAKDNAKVVEDLVVAAQAKAKTIGEKVVSNAVANTEAAFDAAGAIARAKTLPEAARLQLEFVQKQFAVAGSQAKDILTLQAEAARATYESLNAAATKSFEQMKKVG